MQDRDRRRAVAAVAGAVAVGSTWVVALVLSRASASPPAATRESPLAARASITEPFHPADLAYLEKKRKNRRQGSGDRPPDDPDPPDWCESKASNGHCNTESVKKWCAQVCQAYDGDSGCMQSHLDMECSKRSPGSLARIRDGQWACYAEIDHHTPMLACVNNAGQLTSCDGPDVSVPPRVAAEDVDAVLAGIVLGGGCDERMPEGWQETHPRATPDHMCSDFVPWNSGKSIEGKRTRRNAMDCEDYVANGWCAGGKVLDESRTGREYRFPEEHCCVCGGGNTYAPPINDEVACAESEMAVRLSLAAYYNGSVLQRYLPEGTSMAGEYHTKEGGDGFVALAGGSCWLAFRGSQEDRDWVSDAASVYTTDCRAATGEQLGQCGRGFYTQWDSLRRLGMLARLRDLAEAGRCPKGVLVTGHSLGGALAAVAAADIFTSASSTNESTAARRFPLDATPETLRVYTFGEPRSFEWYASDWYNEHIAKVRWLNWGDVIPASPPPKWGFKHWGHAYEIRTDYIRFKHTWKRVPQNFGTSGLYPDNHLMDPYIQRLVKSCMPVLAGTPLE